MAYRLVALDLDGTVMDSDLIIPDAVRQAIAATQERGVHVTLATGRMFSATLPYARQLNIRAPLICYQGALVRDPLTGETYHHVGMPGNLAADAVEILLTAGIFVMACIDERLYITERRPELDLYLHYHPEANDLVVTPDLPAVVGATPPTKLLFVAEPPVVGRELVALADRFAGRLSVVRSHDFFGELTAPGISKGIALAALAERLDIPRAAVLAIGDQENDLSMIEWAGLGLAIGNAVPAVRESAAAILPPVSEGGVAWALERYVLNGSPRSLTGDVLTLR